MKGLLLKELYNVKNQWKYILFIAVVFSLSFGPRGDGILAAMFTFIGTILLLNSLAQDEADQWSKFALTMPVTCHQLILAKYIFAGLLCIFGAVGGILLTMVTRIFGMGGALSVAGLILEGLISTGIVLVMASIMIPVNLKFGVQKSRYVLLGFVAIPILLGVAVTSLDVQIPSMMYFGVSGIGLGVAAVALVAAVLTVSFFISVGITKKKEY